MLKYFCLFLAIAITISTFSQSTIIKNQNFDEPSESWNYSTDIPFFDNNSNGFFGIHDGDRDNDLKDTGIAIKASNINSLIFENDFLFVNDLNDEGDNGTNSEAIITFENIDIHNYRNVILSFDYEVFEFEPSDYISYQVIEDHIYSQILSLPKNKSGSIQIPIKNKTSIISFQLIIKQNGVDDFAGIDNIRLEGDLLIPCSELMISEYIEGTSSTNFRNNFIEIYNPNSFSIDLENYDLVKYTGVSLNISNVLNITGTINAYGTFLIEDIHENIGVTANISTNNAVMDFNGDDKIGLRNSNQIIDLIGEIGDATNFGKDITLRRKSHIQNPNNQFYIEEWDIYGLEDLKDINDHVTQCSGPIPEIEIVGNNIPIVDGTVTTSISNNTYYGTIDLNSENGLVKNFYIKNLGLADLNINLKIEGIHADNFTFFSEPNTTIVPEDSTEVRIRFSPFSMGIKTAIIIVENNDASENPFRFYIQGEGTGANNSPLMITQYYEGAANNKWIEITNVSTEETPENLYFLALYWNDDAESPIGIHPSRNILIPKLNPGQTLKYQSTLEVLEPAYALDGNQIKSSICSFTGDDIIIISTTNDATCWENRLDLIGASNSWGSDICFVRKYGCEGVIANTGFDMDDWMPYDISEINNATPETNQRIGKHYVGSTVYTAANTWNNGLPDPYRNAIIDEDFKSEIQGNLEVCNLTVNAAVVVDIAANNFLSISDNLSVSGILNLQHEASIVMINNDGIITNNGEINIHKTTTALKKYDYTYWSSPVKTATLKDVFDQSPQNSMYHFITQNYADLNNDNLDDDNNAWQRIQGPMEIGMGYATMAPNSISTGATQSIIFKGEINNGIYNIPIYNSEDETSEYDDWNLMGNPYPSAIDAELFLNNSINKNLVNSSIYFWTHETKPISIGNEKRYSASDYSIFNLGTGGIAANSGGVIPKGKIASGQAFFVEAIQEGDIVFQNDMRIKLENDNFFKLEKKKRNEEKIWLNLYNDEGIFSQILIGFLEGASGLLESKYDALRLEGDQLISFYSIAENEPLAIQGLNPFKGDETIPLGITSKADEELHLKIGIDHLEGRLENQDIYLLDNFSNTTHHLNSGTYEFTITEKGVTNDRFSLKFNLSNLNVNEYTMLNESLIIKQRDQSIFIETTKKSIISTVQLFDVLGRKISETQTNQKEVNLNSVFPNKNGVFILRVKLANSKTFTQKIIK